MYDFLLTLLKPLIVFFGKLHAPFSHKKVTGRHYFMLRDMIDIGTVLLTSTHGEVSNLFNPEKIKHAGIYVGELDGDGIRYVIESTGRGVIKTDLVTFMTTKDLIVGCRPTFLTKDDEVLLPIEAEKLIGIPYDFLFSDGDKALYCFETAALCLRTVRPEINLVSKEIVKGKEIFSYETFLDNRLFETAFDSREMG